MARPVKRYQENANWLYHYRQRVEKDSIRDVIIARMLELNRYPADIHCVNSSTLYDYLSGRTLETNTGVLASLMEELDLVLVAK